MVFKFYMNVIGGRGLSPHSMLVNIFVYQNTQSYGSVLIPGTKLLSMTHKIVIFPLGIDIGSDIL